MIRIRHLISLLRVAILAAAVAGMGGVPVDARNLPDMLDTMRTVADDPDATEEDLRRAIDTMQAVVQEHPSSDAAARILVLQPYEGIDFAEFRRRLATKIINVSDDAAPAPPVLQTISPEPPNTGVPQHLTCLRSALEEKTDGSLIVALTLDDMGAIQGLPTLTMPKTPDATGRRDFAAAMVALENCAPFGSIDTGGTYVLAVFSDGQVTLAPAAPEVTAPVLPPASAPADVANTAVEPGTPATVTPVTPDPVTGVLPTFVAPVQDPVPTPTKPQTIATIDSEQALDLNRQAIRDLQARLLVMGYDPNGVDGLIGEGTRVGLRGWQTSIGVLPTGYIDGPQLAWLKTQSQPQLDVWLSSSENAARYNPPPPKKRTRRKSKVNKATGWFRTQNGRWCRRLQNGRTVCQHTTPDEFRR